MEVKLIEHKANRIKSNYHTNIFNYKANYLTDFKFSLGFCLNKLTI